MNTKVCLRTIAFLGTAFLLVSHNGFSSSGGGSPSEGDTRAEPCSYNQTIVPGARLPMACVDGDYPETDSAFAPTGTIFDSSLVLRGLDWNRLGRLAGITDFRKDLVVVGLDPLNSLADLGSLEHVGGHLAISGGALKNLQGLENLHRVDSNLYLVDLEDLTSLQGLNLDSVGDIYLGLNLQLTDLSSLNSLRSMRGLRLWGNTTLQAIEGIDPTLSLLTYFTVDEHRDLQTLQGFSQVDSVGILLVRGNNKLQSITAFAGTSFVGSLDLENNAQLSSLAGFRQLRNIYSLTLDNLPALPNLDDFSFGVQIVQLNLIRMPQLATIPGFALWTQLELVQLQSLTQLQRLDLTPQAATLKTLIVNASDSLSRLDGLAGAQNLQTIALSNLPQLKSMELPQGITLQMVSISHTGLCQSALDAWIQTVKATSVQMSDNRACE